MPSEAMSGRRSGPFPCLPPDRGGDHSFRHGFGAPDRLDHSGLAVGRCWHPDSHADDHHLGPVLPCVYVRLDASRHSGRERAVDAADHRNNSPPRQRHPVFVGQFVFTLLFAIGAVARIDQKIPHALAWVSAVLGLASIVTFLFLIDYAARLLRPASIVWRVGELGIEVIESVYPKQFLRRTPLLRRGPDSERRTGSSLIRVSQRSFWQSISTPWSPRQSV